MVLYGKLSSEVGIKTSADKFYKLIATELHQLQKHCERVRHTKLHDGEDWHDTDTIKHWTCVIDGKIQTCYESIEEIDEQKKRITYKLFGGDIDKHYKTFKLVLQVITKSNGTAAAKWTVEFEKTKEDILPPNGWMELFGKNTQDIDAHLCKAMVAL